MTVRTYIYDLVTQDTIMNAFGVTRESSFLDHFVDTPMVRPMCVFRWQSVSPGIFSSQLSPVNRRVLTVWVHDDNKRGKYDRIDGALRRLRTLLTNVEAVNVGEQGEWLSHVNWDGDSDDLRDDDKRSIMRYSTFTLTGSAI
jgi:hypothetical protein